MTNTDKKGRQTVTTKKIRVLITDQDGTLCDTYEIDMKHVARLVQDAGSEVAAAGVLASIGAPVADLVSHEVTAAWRRNRVGASL